MGYKIIICRASAMPMQQIEATEREVVELYIALLEITKNRLNEKEKSPSSETHLLVEAVRRASA